MTYKKKKMIRRNYKKLSPKSKITMEAASVLIGTGLMLGFNDHTVKADTSYENEAEVVKVAEVETPTVSTNEELVNDTLVDGKQLTDSDPVDTAEPTTEETEGNSDPKSETTVDEDQNSEIVEKEEVPPVAEDTDKRTESNKLVLDATGSTVKVEVVNDNVIVKSENDKYNEYLINTDKISNDFLKVTYTNLNENNKYDGIPIGKVEIIYSNYEGNGSNYFSVYKWDRFGEFLTNAKSVTMSIKLYGLDNAVIKLDGNKACVEVTTDREFSDGINSELGSEGKEIKEDTFVVNGDSVQIQFNISDNEKYQGMYKWIVTPDNFEFVEPEKPSEPDNSLKPGIPDDTTKPDNPDNSGGSDDSNKPDNPITPDTPTNPDKPGDTVTPDTPNNPGGTTTPDNSVIPSTPSMPDQTIPDSSNDTVQNSDAVTQAPEVTENTFTESEEDGETSEDRVAPHAQTSSAKSNKGGNIETTSTDGTSDKKASPENVSTNAAGIIEDTQITETAQSNESTLPETGEENGMFAKVMSGLAATLGIFGLAVTSKRRKKNR
ncbi:MAG: LPXTG cell wall anchor domain-containing protein [Lactobacillus sp.]